MDKPALKAKKIMKSCLRYGGTVATLAAFCIGLSIMNPSIMDPSFGIVNTSTSPLSFNSIHYASIWKSLGTSAEHSIKFWATYSKASCGHCGDIVQT